MIKEEFSNLSIEDKITYDDIFSNEELMAKLTPEVQNKIIFNNLDYLKKQSYTQQKQIFKNLHDEKTFNYLYNYLNIKEQLLFLEHDEILEFMTFLKNKKDFLDMYQDKDIFLRLMRKKTDKKYGLSFYHYFVMKDLPLENQIYILKDLKDQEEYQEQYKNFFLSALDEAKITVLDKIPSDFKSQILYYRLTKDSQAKILFMNKVMTRYISAQAFYDLISLYPDDLTKEELKIIINNVGLCETMSDQIIAKILANETMFEIFKTKVLNTDVIEGYILPKLLSLFKSYEDKREIISKLSKTDLLYKANIGEVKEYLKDKLQEDSTFLKDILNIDNLYSNIDIEEFLPYLSAEAFIKLAPLKDGKPIYLDKIISLIKEKPSLIKYLNDKYALAWTQILSGYSPIYEVLPQSCFSYVYENLKDEKKKQFLLKEFGQRSYKKEMSFKEVERFYEVLENNKQKLFISQVNPKYLLNCYSLSRTEEIKDILVKLIKQNEKAIFWDNNDYYDSFFKLSNPDVIRVLEKVSPNTIVKLYERKSSKLLEDLLLNNFQKNSYYFNSAEYLDEFVYSLSFASQKIVKNKLQEMLESFSKQNPEVYELIKNSDSYNLFKFIERYNNGFFNNELRKEVFFKMVQKYPCIIKTLNYDLLSEEFLSLKREVLVKIAKYPDIQKRIFDLKKKKPHLFELFLSLIKNNSNDEITLFEDKLLFLLNFFEKNNLSLNHELNDKELDNLLRYIIVSQKVFPFSRERINLDKINPLNYEEDLISICDEEYQKCHTIKNLKNIIFQKYFDMAYEDAKCFLYTYVNNIEKLSLSKKVTEFIYNIKLIMNIKDLSSLKKIDENFEKRYSINDVLWIINELKKAYTKEINAGFTKENHEKKKILINGEEVEVLGAGLEFSFLVHSTNAYSSMMMIDDNYYKSWNNGENLKKHGICTTLVSDSCLGFPPLKDEKYGVIFGFNHVNENGISNMAPYDLNSVNNNYLLEARIIPKFMTGEDTTSFTRHTHSEVVIERTNLDESAQVNVQPDFVIITSEMSENQKQNALLASRQMNNGKGISIVYIDIAQIIQDKKTKIYNMLREFTQSKDLDLFKETLSLYESIRCTLFTIENYDFIKTEEIDNIIQNYINYASSLENDEKRANLLSLEKILNEEKRKFTLVNDKGLRYKELDINYLGHIGSIYENIKPVFFHDDEDRLNAYLKEDFKTKGLNAHDETHLLRVTMLSQKICELLKLDETNTMIVLKAAQNHDKARTNDGKNKGHGEKGAQRYKQISPYDERITNMICAIIAYHEKEDDEQTLEDIFSTYQIRYEDRETLKLLCAIVKDADALDRVRFTNPVATLNPEKLRLFESKLLINYARDLLSKGREMREENSLKIRN